MFKFKVPTGKWKSLVAVCLAEILGTAILLFIGCMGCIVTIYSTPVAQMGPISFGLAIAMAVQMFGHISGAHLNPCVTIAARIMNQIEWLSIPFYIVSQFVGALIGYGLIMVLTPTELNTGLCVTDVNPLISVFQGLIIEIIVTILLILLCCAVWDKRISSNTESISLRFGLILGGAFLATSQFTGASLNPTRTLVPAIYQNHWNNHWIYWVGPLLGTFFAAFLYKYGLLDESSI